MAKKVEVNFKLLIVAIAFVIIATVGSAFATYLIFRSNADAASGSSTVLVKKEIGPTFALGEFTLNLTATSNQRRFIKTEIVVEVSDKKIIAELEKRQPQTRDHVITLIRSRTAEQLSSETGMELLRIEIMNNINSLISKGEVTDVYFVDLIIQ